MSAGSFAFPARPYVPGRTPRHAEDRFDAVKACAPNPTRSDEADRNLAWRHGLNLFAAGYFWEAHEVLERVWMNAPENSAERHVVRGVIQLANAALKQRMGRERAAARLAAIAAELFTRAPRDGVVMGMSVERLRAAAQRVHHTDWPQQAAMLNSARVMDYSA